ncbi:UNVERIFIED_CONTAM: hypothetical protein Slati_1691300 [Sesamum latifolium]|uniref:Gag/pol protein n=1 Tax=Sesamum latifolium TaxID=2727402 RepID=A0AAW2WXI7_9LAMI
MILKTNKFNGTNYNDWLRNLWIVLDFENQTYGLDKSLPVTLPEGSTPEERATFKRWQEENRKVRSVVLGSTTNDIQKQYDRHDDVESIMFRMKEVYAVPNRHIRYAATKAFFSTKIIEGSSVREHGFKMLSLVEKLEDLQAGLDNDTYIDVNFQSLPPSYDPFVVNYNMNGLEKSINKLINMLVQYEAATKNSELMVLVGEASTSKAKGKGARRWKRKKDKAKTTASTLSAPVVPVGMGRGKGKVGSKPIRVNDVYTCREKGHWKRECPKLLSSAGTFFIKVNMITNSASWGLDTGCGAHICNNLQVLERSKKLSRDEVVLKLGDGKAVAAEAVGIVHLVVSDQVRIELKDCLMYLA